ncbi:acyltransferase [Rhizobium sp. RU36D]|uniref:acyltransferase family protein n=1 Tax=Rhizobium sp. RU36D TaxID=1907415 RepID=UPI0009D8378E|nr:acyltransferase [Rhizobium sp. RU36D]SMD07661.1 Peptidoglycan/LPS O-acetylase OafA/YrhL, contains acyltransferase and SGNH-hydrolase domains [Rhizobium sp. RU36D]
MQRPQHIGSLDGLRGIASLAVVLSHIILLFPNESWAGALVFGNEAVALFFCLSGFLMAYLYGSKAFTRETATDYLFSRVVRIYPVYLVAVLAVAGLSLLAPLDYPQPLLGSVQIMRHVLLLGSTGVFWSIPPEIQFYVFFLLLWFWMAAPRRRLVVGVAIGILFMLLAITGFPGPGILLPSKLPYFLFGALAGWLFSLMGTGQNGPVVGIITLGALGFFFASRALFNTENDFWGLSSAIAAAGIVFMAASGSALSNRVLTASPLRFLGKISFSLYLFHMPVMFLTSRALPTDLPAPIAISVCVLAAIGFSTLSYRLIEAPSRRMLMNTWRRRRELRGVPA